MKSTWPGAVARRLGISGEIDFTTARVGMTLHVPCAAGDHVADFTVEPGCAPDMVVKRMLAKGWTIGSKPTCPAHGRRERRPHSKEKTAMPAAISTKPVEQAGPTNDAKAARREAHDRIAIYFDIALGRYGEGYSDQRIADETGVAVSWVKQRREEEFGPLKEPTEIGAIKAQLEQFRTECAAAHAMNLRKIDELSGKLVTLCRAQGWPLPA